MTCQYREPGDGLSGDFIQASRALICIINGDGRLLLANPALQRFTGYPVETLFRRRFWEVFVVPEHADLARDLLAEAMVSGVAPNLEGEWLTAAGARRRVAMQNDVLRDDAGRPRAVACVGLDVTDQRLREEQLHRRAQTDPLTGIANRSALFEVLAHMLAPGVGTGGGVLFCDLDGFKGVNDRYGHAVGDRLLIEVARRLREVAAPDDVVARLGGDEFVLVCPRGDETRLRALNAAVMERVRRPFAGPQGPLSVTVSVGTATSRPGEGPDELVVRADRAMYKAKPAQVRRHPRPPVPGPPL